MHINDVVEQAVEQPWLPSVTSNEELEAALESLAGLHYERKNGQAKALQERINKYSFTLGVVLGKIDRKIADLSAAIDAYAHPMMNAQGRAVYTGAYGTYRVTKRRSAIASVDLNALRLWCSENTTELPLIGSQTKEVYVANKDLIEAYIHETGVVPDGVELQEMESYTIKPDLSGLEGGNPDGQANPERLPA